MKITVTIFFILTIISQSIFGEDLRQADREQLRALLVKLTAALNNQNMDELSGNLSKNFRFTTLDQKVITSTDELKKYYDGLFKANNALIKSYKTTPKIDDEALFINDNVCFCVGSALDEYTLSNKDELKLPIRWSSLMEKEDGVWKVRLLHLSASFYDNPVISKITSTMKLTLYLGVAIAFVAGIIAQFFLSKRFKK